MKLIYIGPGELLSYLAISVGTLKVLHPTLLSGIAQYSLSYFITLLGFVENIYFVIGQNTPFVVNYVSSS